MKRTTLITSAIIGAVSVGAISVYADNYNQNVTAFNASKITIQKAISAVEADTGGKAMSASFEKNMTKTGFEVELLMADGTVADYFIDSQTSAISIDQGHED